MRTRVVPVLILVLLGGFLLLSTTGAVPREQMARYWGVIPAIIGLALLVGALVDRERARGLRLPGVILLAVAAFSFLRPLPQIGKYWPLILIAVGVIVLLGGFRRRAGS